MADRAATSLELAPKIRDLFFEAPGRYVPSRYKVARGGRGSAKSWGFAKTALALACARRVRMLCARELQMSIQESVHRLLSDQIHRMGLRPWFQPQQQVIYGPHGSEFIFSGIRNNPTKIKSMEGIDIVWIEEAEKLSERSWEILIPTIRSPGSEIWATFNPDVETDPTSQRFIVAPPEDARIVEINWNDNPWFPDELRKEKDYLYRVDPEAADHVWGGQFRRNSEAQVLRGKYVVEGFEPKTVADASGAAWDGPYFGADWGFSVDPTALVKMWIHQRTLYIEYEAYGVGVEIDKLPAMFDKVPGAKQHVIRADNARPETISYLQRNGYPRITSCEKWKGSVEDGVEHLRSYERIVVHPRCTHVAQEARLWSYKVDRLTKDVLPVLSDGNDHCWDGVRYGLQPLIKRRSSSVSSLRI